MILRSLVLIICAIAIGGWERSGLSQVQIRRKHVESSTRKGLQLLVELNKGTFSGNEIATLRVRLKNVGQSPITLYRRVGWGRSSSFTVYILDERGIPVRPSIVDDSHHFPPFALQDFVTINSGESFDNERKIDFRSDGISLPGKYQIYVRYHSPIPRSSAPEGLSFWATENGVLRSKPFTFRISQ